MAFGRARGGATARVSGRVHVVFVVFGVRGVVVVGGGGGSGGVRRAVDARFIGGRTRRRIARDTRDRGVRDVNRDRRDVDCDRCDGARDGGDDGGDDGEDRGVERRAKRVRELDVGGWHEVV